MSASDTATGRTGRWRGAIAASLALAGIGVAANRPALLFGSAVPLAFVAYGALDSVPAVGESGLVADRTVTPQPAPPGSTVRVRLTLRNESDRRLPEVRVVDGTPEELAAVGGTPRGIGRIDPGETLRVEYELTAKRGEFDFDPPRVGLRGRAGVATAVGTPVTAGDDTVVCRLDAGAPPMDEQVGRRGGAMTSDEGGPGVEFHSVREYRHGDPASRVDWRHYAKRGRLATVDYREQRAASVVLVVDAREPNRVVAAPGRPSAVELCAYGVVRALDDLVGSGHEVGVAVLGPTNDRGGLRWIAPGTGRTHRGRVIELLRTAVDDADGTGDADRTEGGEAEAGELTFDEQVRTVGTRAPPSAQLLLLSPLLDDPPVDAVSVWQASGRASGVLAPDVLAGNTVSGQHAVAKRAVRLAAVQATGARAVDWQRGTPLPVVLDRALAAAGGARDAGGSGAGVRG